MTLGTGKDWSMGSRAGNDNSTFRGLTLEIVREFQPRIA